MEIQRGKIETISQSDQKTDLLIMSVVVVFLACFCLILFFVDVTYRLSFNQKTSTHQWQEVQVKQVLDTREVRNHNTSSGKVGMDWILLCSDGTSEWIAYHRVDHSAATDKGEIQNKLIDLVFYYPNNDRSKLFESKKLGLYSGYLFAFVAGAVLFLVAVAYLLVIIRRYRAKKNIHRQSFFHCNLPVHQIIFDPESLRFQILARDDKGTIYESEPLDFDPSIYLPQQLKIESFRSNGEQGYIINTHFLPPMQDVKC
ncbi:MAG: hypothetical protein LAT68_09290 [Cyclobacteriaceae bacterium]|nr:hypothetical protein [Cyclobacteriaceae bacterium]MCH8516507.1 hypothetical protein [Cyclobacteriaceae bacterium]